MGPPLVGSPEPGSPHLQHDDLLRSEATYELPSPMRHPDLKLRLAHLGPRSKSAIWLNNEDPRADPVPVIEGLEYIDSINDAFPTARKGHGYLHEMFFWILYEPYRGLMSRKLAPVTEDEPPESTVPPEDGFEDFTTDEDCTIRTPWSKLSSHQSATDLPDNDLSKPSAGTAHNSPSDNPHRHTQPPHQTQQHSWTAKVDAVSSVAQTFAISHDLASFWKQHLASANLDKGGSTTGQIYQSVVHLPHIPSQARLNHRTSRDTMSPNDSTL